MKNANPFYTPCLGAWFLWYKSKTGETYIFSGGKDGANLKQLIKKIEIKVRERSMEVNEENMVNSFKAFLNSITDQWILANLEIPNVNSKFNSLYVKAVSSSPLGIRDSVEDYLRRKNSERTG